MAISIGKYVIERQLGSGTMGTVYLGYDSSLDRRAAIKVMKTEVEDETLRTRFFLEARSIARLDHPNIIKVWDLDSDAGNRPYIAMEYIEGDDLKTFIEKKLFLPFDQKLKIIIDVCMGLDHAHQNGVIHRDIKPGNIRINRNGEAKILDFGLARLESGESTRTSGPIGSPYYMSPEQWRGEWDLDRRSDLFSVAAVLYELISYVRPFEADYISAVRARIVSEPNVPLKQILPACAPLLNEILDRALAKERENRFASCLEFARALQRLQPEIAAQREEVRKKIDRLEAEVQLCRQRSPELQIPPPGEATNLVLPAAADEALDYGVLLQHHARLQENLDSLSEAVRATLALKQRRETESSATRSIFEVGDDSGETRIPPAPGAGGRRGVIRLLGMLDVRRRIGAYAQPRVRKRIYAVAAVLALVLIGTFFYRREVTPPKAPEPPGAGLPKLIQTPAGEMVLVAAGTFLEGPDRVAATLPAFYIDRTEVTNAAFEAFCRETNRPLPDGFSKSGPDYPVVNVTIEDARAFARWARKRLPTLREWEKAARGTDGRTYPWGNQDDAALANVNDNPLGSSALSPADSFQTGDSPWGVRQMVGNAWELIDEMRRPSAAAEETFRKLLPTPASADEPWYLMMGGSVKKNLIENAAFDSWASVPGRFRAEDIGFRCVRDADQ